MTPKSDPPQRGGAGRGQGRKPASMPAASPSPDTIRALRATAGMTQAQAAALVGAGMRAWMGWETPAGEPNARAMSPAVWFAFCARLALTPAELARVEAMMASGEQNPR